MLDFAAKFASGMAYGDFLDTYGTEEHQRRWSEVHQSVELTAEQRSLLSGFVREMKVVCMAGAWCGDCVEHCPIFDHFSQLTDKIQVRFIDRDADPELAATLKVCGGARVPAVVFLSEDDMFVGLYGDRTLSRYRWLAQQKLGAGCPTGLVVPTTQLLASVTQDWLDEFERVQLILRTSARLRERHGD